VLADAEAIVTQVPSVKVAPRSTLRANHLPQQKLQLDDHWHNSEFLSVRSFDVARGRFITDLDVKRNNQVIVLGFDLANRLFG